MRRAALALLALAGVARADAIFPPGSALGLEPPPGFVPAIGFTGFERPADGASLVLVEAPPEACADMRAAMAARDRLAVQGIEFSESRPFALASGEGQLFTGVHRTANGPYAKWALVACGGTATALVTAQVFGFPPGYAVAEEIEAVLATLAFRPLTLEDRRAALAFTFAEAEGLVLREVAGGGTAVLTPPDAPRAPATPVVLIDAAREPAPAAADEEAVARQMARPRGAYANIEVLAEQRAPFAGREDAIRIDLRALDRSAGRPVRVLQFVAFRASGGYIRLLATALDSDFAGLLPAFERIAASVEVK